MQQRSRNTRSTAVSLFAFQDIMMAVVGILIIVTLIMCLELTTAITEAAPAGQQETDVSGLLIDLENRLKAAKEEHDTLKEEVARLVELSTDQPDRLKIMLDQRRRDVEQIQQLNDRVALGLPKWQSATKEAERKRNQLGRLESKIAQLEAAIKDQRANPGLTYILQGGQQKVPILLEVSGSVIGIGFTEESASALWLTHKDEAERISQLMSFVRTRVPSREYFLVLLKPSAFDSVSESVLGKLEKADFDVGIDLIQEDSHVLARDKTY